jgi:hypothetical protein
VVTAGRLWAGDALNVIPEHAQIGIRLAQLGIAHLIGCSRQVTST